jgi:hypothetical protein
MWLQNVTVMAFIVNLVGEILMFIHNVMEKLFEFGPFYVANSRQC